MRTKSIIKGRDNDVLDQLFRTYPRPAGLVIDVTCNQRRMWKKLVRNGVIFCDIDKKVKPDVVCDFRQLPFANDSVGVLVFDPPHLPKAAGTDKSLKQYVEDYGLKDSVTGNNVNAFFPPFLTEARRVLVNDGLIFCKLTDYVHNHAFQWLLVDFITAVRSISGLTPCDLIIKCDPCAGNLKSGRWKKCHHARRNHCYFVVVRKGRCEPHKVYTPSMVGTFMPSSPRPRPAPSGQRKRWPDAGHQD